MYRAASWISEIWILNNQSLGLKTVPTICYTERSAVRIAPSSLQWQAIIIIRKRFGPRTFFSITPAIDTSAATEDCSEQCLDHRYTKMYSLVCTLSIGIYTYPVNSIPPDDTIWCHHGHGLSISLWEFVCMGSLILGVYFSTWFLFRLAVSYEC